MNTKSYACIAVTMKTTRIWNIISFTILLNIKLRLLCLIMDDFSLILIFVTILRSSLHYTELTISSVYIKFIDNSSSSCKSVLNLDRFINKLSITDQLT